MSPLTVLQKAKLSEICYLEEAVYWRAFGRFPITALQESSNLDERDGPEFEGRLEPPMPFSFALTPEESAYAGLEDDPSIAVKELIFSSDSIEEKGRLAAEFVHSADKLDHGIPNGEHTDVDEALIYIREYKQRVEAYLDRHRNEILLKLQDGDLVAFGTPILFQDLEANLDSILDAEHVIDNEKLLGRPLKVAQIPPETWQAKNVLWRLCCLNAEGHCYVWIHLRTKDLIEAIPPKNLVRPDDLSFLGGSFAIASPTLQRQQPLSTNLGRPTKYDWEAFYLEITRLLLQDDLPQKQEAGVAQMQEWFESEFGSSPGKTTIADRVRPFYAAFVRKTESQNSD